MREEGHTVRNHYLEGNYAPVRHEHTVTGTIPAHLDGRYLRNGPNPIADVDPQTYHWFTGDGMVHGVRLRDGKAYWYRNRWIRTPGSCTRCRTHSAAATGCSTRSSKSTAQPAARWMSRSPVAR